MSHFWDGFEKRAELTKVAMSPTISAEMRAAAGGVKKQLTHKDYLKNIGWNPAKNQALRAAPPAGQTARVAPAQANAARQNFLKSQMNTPGQYHRAMNE